jgi:hypothetical protein
VQKCTSWPSRAEKEPEHHLGNQNGSIRDLMQQVQQDRLESQQFQELDKKKGRHPLNDPSLRDVHAATKGFKLTIEF